MKNHSQDQQKLLRLLLQKKGISLKEINTIPKRQSSNSELIPISLTQLELWFFAQFYPENCIYNLPCIYRIEGLLNVPVLEESLREIVKRHEILRTNFTCIDGKVFQKITPDPVFDFSILELQCLSESEQKKETKRLFFAEIDRPFDLEKDSLFRSKIIKLTENNYLLIITIHHIIADGWSLNILTKELGIFYEAFCLNKPSPLAELPIQYGDFSLWQWQSIKDNSWQSHLDFWKQQIGINPPILKLPTDYPRTTAQPAEAALHHFLISQDLTNSLQALSHQEGATLYMILLAALKILFFYYTQQTEIIIGGISANRKQAETQDLIGLMTQFLPLYTHVESQVNFRDLLHQVKEMSLGFYAHQEIPFITLVEELKPIRDPQYALFHQVIFLFQNAPKQDLKLANMKVTDELRKMDIDPHSAENDLTISLEEIEQGIIGVLVYKTDLFSAETITKMEQYFQQLLKNIVAYPNKTISELCPLSETVSFSPNTSPLSLSINEIKSNELPHNLTEKMMINIWQEVLELEGISVNDNFFELGGNSQKVIQVIDKISKTLKINCPLRDFFENPTIARLITTFKDK
jgi:NRPS condensation-like uncharacterized protein/acyl carrier protein